MWDGQKPSDIDCEKHRRKDIEFLTKLKQATLEELLVMFHNHSHKSSPTWKVIAISRAIKKESI